MKDMTGNIVDIKHQISLTIINLIRLYVLAQKHEKGVDLNCKKGAEAPQE
jgi:hypothetical protein